MLRGAPGGISHAAENSLRVDATRIKQLNLVGELIIGKSMLQRTINEFERSHSKDPARKILRCAGQSRVLGELQKSVMRSVVSVDQLFRRFPRVVRDVVSCKIRTSCLKVGPGTDLGRAFLTRFESCHRHLVRNAADHGIESAVSAWLSETARRNDSPRFYHEGDQVSEVSDDGRVSIARKSRSHRERGICAGSL
jgi:two-component system chemotaxis sensor kinase CheA